MCLGILEEDWDVAILLDACRYDMFKKVYRKYLPKGRLEKRVGANETIEWLYKNFPKKHYPDIVYVSGHPGINSLGVPWGRFNAKEKFAKVYDAWLYGWDKRIGTTRPEAVRKMAIKAVKENPNKRIIVHFMQPHIPYRGIPYPEYLLQSFGFKKTKSLTFKLRGFFGKIIDTNFYLRIFYFWFKHTISNPKIVIGGKNQMEYFYVKKFKNKLKYYYKDNLKWALESVKRFCKSYKERKIVITADHGEAFGERNHFFHPPFNNNPIIRYVPFYRVNF